MVVFALGNSCDVVCNISSLTGFVLGGVMVLPTFGPLRDQHRSEVICIVPALSRCYCRNAIIIFKKQNLSTTAIEVLEEYCIVPSGHDVGRNDTAHSLESRQGRDVNFVRETAWREVRLKRFVTLTPETEKFSVLYSRMESIRSCPALRF